MAPTRPARSDAVVCVEAAHDGISITAVAALVLADGRVRVQRVGTWSATVKADQGMRDLSESMRPRKLGWFPTGPGAALSATMRKLKAEPIKGTAVAEACMTLADYVAGRRVLHPDDPLLKDHVARTTRVGSKGSWTFDRSSMDPIDGAWAVAGALYLALNDKPKPPKRGVILPST